MTDTINNSDDVNEESTDIDIDIDTNAQDIPAINGNYYIPSPSEINPFYIQSEPHLNYSHSDSCFSIATGTSNLNINTTLNSSIVTADTIEAENFRFKNGQQLTINTLNDILERIKKLENIISEQKDEIKKLEDSYPNTAIEDIDIE